MPKKVKKKESVDAKKLARALGANSVISPGNLDRKGRKFIEFYVVAKDGCQIKRIYRIPDKETSRYKLLCETEGQFIFHCIFMGRHTNDFHNRVYGYRTKKPTQEGMKIRVVFYEKK